MLEQLKAKRQSFSELLTLSFEFLKLNFMDILPYTLAIGAVFGFLSALITGLQINAIYTAFANLNSLAQYTAPSFLVTTVVPGLLNILTSLAFLVVTAGVYKLILDKIHGKASSFVEVVNYLKSAGLPIVFTCIVVGLALSGLTLLLIVPGIYFGVKWGFSILIAVNEGKYNFKATEASTLLTNGRWITTFGYLLGIALIIGIPVSLVSGLILSILGGNALFSIGFTDFNLIGFILAGTITSALSFGISSTVIGVFQSLMYINWMHFPAEAPKAYVPSQPTLAVTEAVVVTQPTQTAAEPTQAQQ